MWLFLLLWFLAITIIFSIEILAGLQWYKHLALTTALSNQKSMDFFSKKQSGYLQIYFWWFNFFFSFFSGIMAGWFIEKNFRLLFKTNLLWQQKQPEFYRKTSGEKRVFLPWFIIEFPLLIIALINFILLLTFKSYTNTLISTSFFVIGFTLGQLIEVIREYQVIIKMDRPEKPPMSLLQKISPSFPSKYSLIIGQLYCRAFVPLFFLYIALFIPMQIMILPNANDKNLLILFIFLVFGISARWFYEKDDKFYFARITVINFLFTVIKLFILVFVVGAILFNSGNIYLLSIVALICGFIIPWFPEKLRS